MYETIVEPFAGAAGYSTRYPERQVILFDVDPVICGLWDYLIHVPESEIRSLPDEVSHVDDVDACQEARWLIGFWLNKGATAPMKSASAWARSGIRPNSYWGPVVKERIASQVTNIRHWTIEQKSYEDIGDIEATWFVDPPYQGACGRYYRHDSVDFPQLASWCESRRGQTIVCEQEGADWLPFSVMGQIKSNPSSRGKGRSKEVIWLNAV